MTRQMQELYDPMVYDVMRERANRLKGEYLFQESQTSDPVKKAQWERRRIDLVRKVREIDAMDEAAVRAASAEFSRGLDELRLLSVAAG